jgi:D-xylose transport system permease protein
VYRIWVATVLIAVGLVIWFTHLSDNSLIAILLAMCLGTSIGVLTGFLVAKVGIPSFVVTLALFLGWQGVLLQFVGQGASINVGGRKFIFDLESATSAITPVWGWILWAVFAGGYLAFTLWRAAHNRANGLVADPISVVLVKGGALAVVTGVAVWLLNQNRSLNPLIVQEGIPRIVPILLVLFVILTLILAKTQFGRHLYATGGNTGRQRGGPASTWIGSASRPLSSARRWPVWPACSRRRGPPASTAHPVAATPCCSRSPPRSLAGRHCSAAKVTSGMRLSVVWSSRSSRTG